MTEFFQPEDNTNWIENYICFVGPLADLLFGEGIVNNGVFLLGKQRKILSVIQQAADPGTDKQLTANAMLYAS